MTFNLEDIIANSYKNFHAKGFNYLCLKRSPEHTVKIYTFEGAAATAPEVVNPHDHRYDFVTVCLSGHVTNRTYRRWGFRGEGSATMQEFSYRTPLNGGNGFTWKRQQRLYAAGAKTYRAGEYYHMEAEMLHTIQIWGSETVLLLHQFEDKPLVNETSTFTPNREPPDTSGCYEKFTPGEVVDLLNKLHARTGRLPADLVD